MKLKYFLIIALFLISSGMELFSQSVTTAAINGEITDNEGKPLIGATVKATHVPSGTVAGAFTNKAGRFNILGLRPGGPYEIMVTMIGYEPYKASDITLSIGQNLTLNLKLVEKGVKTKEIEVVADRNDIISSDRTGASQYISEEDIKSLPTISRSIHDYSRLSPLIVSSTSDGSNVGGRNSRYNNIQVDGAIMSDAFGLSSSGTPGGGTDTEPISLDAIDEFQVSISPFDVRQGGFTGGLINAITRSGTNYYKGSIYTYGRNQALVGTLVDTAGIRQFYPDYYDYTIGGRVGGPIMTNEMFFFANAEIRQRIQPQTDNVYAVQNGELVLKPVLDEVIDIAKNKYNYDPGSYSEYTRNTGNYKIFLRLDYNLSQQNRLTLRHNFVKANQSNDVTRTYYALAFSNREYVSNSLQNQTVLQLNSAFSNMANELRVAFTSVNDERTPAGSPFPDIVIRDVDSIGTDLQLGTRGVSQANSLDQKILEITDNLSIFSGDHVFTFGTTNQYVNFDNLFIQNYWGYYLFSGIEDFRNGKPAQYLNTYSLLDNPKPSTKFGYVQLGLYAQDEWSILPNVKITYGIRGDYYIFPDQPLYNPTFSFDFPGYYTDKIENMFSFSPRFGFNWDINSDKSTQIRGGIGIFSGRTPGVWISNQYGNTGMDLGKVDIQNTGVPDFSADPYNQPNPFNTPNLQNIQTSEINITDNNFHMPQLFRLNLGYDQKLLYGFVGTVELIYGKTIYDVFYQDLNRQYQRDSLGNVVYLPDGRPLYSNNNASPHFTDVILMKNTDQGWQSSISFQLQKPYRRGFIRNLSVNLAYTYSRAMDVNSATSSTALSNWQYNHTADPNVAVLSTSLFEIRHRILANFTYTHEWDEDVSTTIGLYYEGRSGSPMSFTFQGDMNNDRTPDANADNDLIYIPTGPDDPKVILESGNWDQLMHIIDQFPELADQKGKIMERYSVTQPWRNDLDMRITQTIKTMGKQKIELTLDFQNLLSMINTDWGQVLYVSNNSYNLIRYNGIDEATGKIRILYRPNAKGNDRNDIFTVSDFSSRWQMQLGVRYNF